MTKTLPFKMIIETPMEKYRAETFFTKEPETVAWIDSFTDGWFLDIGANVGIYSLYCALNRSMSVIAAEPVPENYYRLAENVKISKLKSIVHLMLAFDREVGIKPLFVKNREIGSSGSQVGFPIDEDGKIFSPARETFAVCVTVDEFVLKTGLTPNYIKIDVDGNEGRIVAGMNRYLGNINLRSVLIEINSDYDKIIKTMKKCGFTDDNVFNKMADHSTIRRKRENIKARNVIFTRA